MTVWTEYYWDCPECDETNRIAHRPRLGEILTCRLCDSTETCMEIAEEYGPTKEPRKKGLTR